MDGFDLPGDASPWFGVRWVFRMLVDGEPTNTYEERVTVWRADSFEQAIELAEREAATHADTEAGISEYLGIAQAFRTSISASTIEPGDEVFSLMRDSELEPPQYIDRFFDTGSERQNPVDR